MRYPQMLAALAPKLADIERWNWDDYVFLANMMDALGKPTMTDADLVRLKDVYRRYVVETK